MNEAATMSLAAILATGDSDGAQRYLSHFPRAERAPAEVRARLVARVHPEVMAIFERLAPWLLDTATDDTRARVRRALEEAGTEGLTASGIADKVRRVPVEEIGEAVNAMREAGEVTVEKQKTKSRPRYVHRLAEHSAGLNLLDAARNPFANTPGRFIPDSELYGVEPE